MNQKEHHKTKSFKEEYIDFLQKFNVEYKEQFLFDWIELVRCLRHRCVWVDSVFYKPLIPSGLTKKINVIWFFYKP